MSSSGRKWSSRASSTARYLTELEQTAGLGTMAVIVGGSEGGLCDWSTDSVLGAGPLLADVHAILGMVNNISNLVWAALASPSILESETDYFMDIDEMESTPKPGKKQRKTSSSSDSFTDVPTTPQPETANPLDRTEIGIRSAFQLIANGQLLVLSMEASKLVTYTNNILPSIGFVYLGFAIKALFDMILALRAASHAQSKEEALTAKINVRLQTLKLFGWAALTCSSALGPTSLPLMLFGYAVLGTASVFHLATSAIQSYSGLQQAWHHPWKKSFFSTFSFDNQKRERLESQLQNNSKNTIQEQYENARALTR